VYSRRINRVDGARDGLLVRYNLVLVDSVCKKTAFVAVIFINMVLGDFLGFTGRRNV